MRVVTSIILLISLCGYSQEVQRPLNGPVKEMLEKFYTPGTNPTFSRKTEYYFDKEGVQTSRFEYRKFVEADYSELRNDPAEHNNDEVFLLVYRNDFDETGNLTLRYRNEKVKANDRYYLHFQDEKGNDTLIETYDMNNEIMESCVYKYDEKGNCVAWQGFNEKREIASTIGKTSYVYYDDGSIKEKVLDSVSWKEAFPVTTFRYDEKGNLLEEYHLNSEKKKIYHQKGEVVNGKLKTLTLYRDGREDVIYKYNELGQELSMAKHKAGMTDPVFVRSYTYNEKGNVATMEMFQTQGAIKIEWGFTYKYDEHDNWVERMETEMDREFRLTKREIVYYE